MQTRAARLVEHGKPLMISEIDSPEPADDEVLIDMAYGGVNPVDRYGAIGRVAPDAPLPRTLGSEGSGTVDGRAVIVRGHGLGASRDGLWATQAVEGMAMPHCTSSHQIVTVSVGLACTKPNDSQRPGDLIEAADAALYAAKHRGRNAVVEHGFVRITDGADTIALAS